MVKPSKFEINVRSSGDEARLQIEGDLDMATTPQLDEAVKQALGNGARELVVDLEALTFADSSGLRTLIALHRRSQEEGWTLRITRPHENAFTVFRVSGADQALPFVES